MKCDSCGSECCPTCGRCKECGEPQLELETFDADELGLDPEKPWDA